MGDREALLKQVFGHERFRKGQEALIDALLSGRDALGVMPTGAGKSVCYQLPALMLEGMTLVISPLISLMKDQVTALTTSGVPAAFVNSTLSSAEYADTMAQADRGAYRLLYVAPERLLTPGFTRLAQSVKLALIAVDEAHCVSQWGQDFRPSYLDIDTFIKSLPERPPVGAFTATATEAVKADIVKLLSLREPVQVTTGFDRPNLFFDVEKPSSKDSWLLQYLQQHAGETGIVYCATRKTVEDVCLKLMARGISATRYHAGLPDEERRQNQEDFVYDRSRVMVATNAFGMGIDKSNVGFVVHYNMPKDLESYYQEAGRAGRDGARAECVLLFSAGDVQTARYLINAGAENEALTPEERETVFRRDMERLNRMVGYCRTPACLRSRLLGYFGEASAERCENCGNCVGELRHTDITVEAQKILSGVARVERKYAKGLGAETIAGMLNGSEGQKIARLGLKALPTYGIMRDTPVRRIRAYIDALIEQGYLYATESNYPVLRLTGRARDVLFNGEQVTFTERVPKRAEPAPRKEKPGRREPADEGLFDALRKLRTRIATQERVPAYMVFSNATLTDMASMRPRNMQDFLMVSGVGEYKAVRYGEAFLKAIDDWEAGEA